MNYDIGLNSIRYGIRCEQTTACYRLNILTNRSKKQVCRYDEISALYRKIGKMIYGLDLVFQVVMRRW